MTNITLDPKVLGKRNWLYSDTDVGLQPEMFCFTNNERYGSMLNTVGN